MGMSKKKKGKKSGKKKAAKRMQKVRGCIGCVNYDQWYCTIAGPKEEIPARILNGKKKCKKFDRWRPSF
jgi:hypothetical protein